MYPDGDPDHSQNFMGSKLDQNTSSDFFHEVPTRSIRIILLTSKQAKGQTDKQTVMKIMPLWWRYKAIKFAASIFDLVIVESIHLDVNVILVYNYMLYVLIFAYVFYISNSNLTFIALNLH